MSRAPFKPWLAFPALALAIALLLWGVDAYRHRFVRSDRDLFRFLPGNDATLFYVNVAGLRHAGLQQLLAGAGRAEEADYRDFVRETRLDYRKDIDAIAGAVASGRIWFLVRGRFDWDKLRAYAAAHGGKCAGSVCQAPASKAGRWASFVTIQPDVMGLALSSDPLAANLLRPPGHAFREAIPDRPIWARLSPGTLKNPSNLPLVLRIFAISLQFANPVVLAVKAGGRADAYKLELDAQCANAAMADTVRNQLTLDTKLLSLEFAREHLQPNAADLTGLLTAGSFQVVGNRVIGTWPLRKELLKALQ